MSIAEKLRKARKAVVAGALAMAAVVVPIKGQAKASAPVTNDTTQATAPENSAKKKMLEEAVRRGAPEEEIAKYVDFPGFIPVTKEGQFDEAKADEWSKALAPYMKELVEGDKIVTAAEAYKSFKKTTGREDVSFEDFQAVQKVAETAAKDNIFKWANGSTFLSLGVLTAGMTFMAGKGAWDLKDEAIIPGYFGERSIDPTMLTGSIVAGVTALAFGAATVFLAGAGMETFKRTPEQAVRDAYANAYKIHVDEAVKGQQQQFKLLEMNQVKQMLQNTQGGK